MLLFTFGLKYYQISSSFHLPCLFIPPADKNEGDHDVPSQAHHEDEQVGHGHHHQGGGQEDYGLGVSTTTKVKLYICNKQIHFNIFSL